MFKCAPIPQYIGMLPRWRSLHLWVKHTSREHCATPKTINGYATGLRRHSPQPYEIAEAEEIELELERQQEYARENERNAQNLAGALASHYGIMFRFTALQSFRSSSSRKVSTSHC